MLSAYYIANTIPQELAEVYEQLETDILKEFGKGLNNPTKLQVKKYEIAVGALITSAILKSKPIIANTYMKALSKGLKGDEVYYKKLLEAGYVEKYVELKDSKAINKILNTAYKSQIADIKVMCENIKLDAIDRFTQAAKQVYYGEKVLDSAVISAVDDFADSGTTAFFSAKGRRYEASSYIRMQTRTRVANMVNIASFERMREVGIDYIQVSSHAGARPLCAPYQGQIYTWHSKSDGKYPALSDTSYGEPAGLFGINCGHTFWAIDPRMPSEQPVFDDEYNDTTYQNTQIQRYNERQIRKYKNRAETYAEIKNMDNQVIKSNLKVKEWQKKQRDFLEKTGLPRHYAWEK